MISLNIDADIDQNRDDYEIRSWELEPGDAIVFHFSRSTAPLPTFPQNSGRGFAARWRRRYNVCNMFRDHLPHFRDLGKIE